MSRSELTEERTFWRGELSEKVEDGLVGRGPGNGGVMVRGIQRWLSGTHGCPHLFFVVPEELGPYSMRV